MPGKARPSLRAKTIENVKRCNLSKTDKDCIIEVFLRYESMVAVRNGCWIKNQSIADVCGEYRCSLCGFMYCEADPKYPPYKYCPECGANNE